MAFEGALAFGGQGIPGDRFPVLKLLSGGQVTGVLELAELGAEIAIGFAEQLAQTREAERVGGAEQDQGAQPRAVLEQTIEAIEAGRGFLKMEVVVGQGF